MIALGLAAAQFLAHDLVPGFPLTRALSIVLVVFGVFIAMAGARRYFLNHKRIETGELRPARFSVTVAMILIVIVGILATAFILFIRR